MPKYHMLEVAVNITPNGCLPFGFTDQLVINRCSRTGIKIGDMIVSVAGSAVSNRDEVDTAICGLTGAVTVRLRAESIDYIETKHAVRLPYGGIADSKELGSICSHLRGYTGLRADGEDVLLFFARKEDAEAMAGKVVGWRRKWFIATLEERAPAAIEIKAVVFDLKSEEKPEIVKELVAVLYDHVKRFFILRNSDIATYRMVFEMEDEETTRMVLAHGIHVFGRHVLPKVFIEESDDAIHEPQSTA